MILLARNRPCPTQSDANDTTPSTARSLHNAYFVASARYCTIPWHVSEILTSHHIESKDVSQNSGRHSHKGLLQSVSHSSNCVWKVLSVAVVVDVGVHIYQFRQIVKPQLFIILRFYWVWGSNHQP